MRPFDVFLEVFTDQIKRTQFEPGVHAPRRSFIRARQDKRRERAVGIYQQVPRLRDICTLVIAAVENVSRQA